MASSSTRTPTRALPPLDPRARSTPARGFRRPRRCPARRIDRRAALSDRRRPPPGAISGSPRQSAHECATGSCKRGALERCLGHRNGLKTSNPHVIVTKGTKLNSAPASPYYMTHVLDRAGPTPKTARNTRLVGLAASHDPKLLAAGVLAVLASGVWRLILRSNDGQKRGRGPVRFL